MSGADPRACAAPRAARSGCLLLSYLAVLRTPSSSVMGKVSILREFWSFLRLRKKYWLAPIVVVLVVLSLLIVLTQGSALAPFIYSLF